MDVKGISWFGNVYQKFETMCLEVEEAVCQDTVKYVENQVQTVGASVKKFYSEVVDDLLSPSLIDPVKVNSLSCTGAHKKPKLGIKEEPKKQSFEDRNAATRFDKGPTYASFDRFSNADPAVPCNPVSSTIVTKSMGIPSKKLNLVIKRKPKTMIPNSSEVPKVTDPTAANPAKDAEIPNVLKIINTEAPTDRIFEQQLDPDAVSWDSKETEGIKTGHGSQMNSKPKQIVDALVNPAELVLSDGTGSFHPTEIIVDKRFKNGEGYEPVNPDDALNHLINISPSGTSSDTSDTVNSEVPYADGDVENKDYFNNLYSEEWVTHNEVANGWNIETITSDEDDDDFVVEGTGIMGINARNNNVLEESCIIVDRDSLLFDSPKEPKQKHKSYKKKLRDAFSSRGKSTTKKEYRQLAAQYESANVEHERCSASSSLHTSPPTSEEKKLKSSIQICESEWEIL